MTDVIHNTSLEPRYVSVREAAHILGVPESTVRHYAANGTLPSRRLGHRVLIPLSALDLEADQ